MRQTERDTTASLVRVRTIASDNFALLVGALIVLALAGGYLTYATHVDPGTTTETREVAAWESAGEFDHRATVVNETDAFERGTVLRNRSTYFTAVSPTLEGSFAYAYAASDGGNLATNVSLALVVRSVSEESGGETSEYWRVERPLESARVDSLGPGDRVEVPFSTNVTAAGNWADRVQRQHGTALGQTRISLVARVDIAGARNGEQVDRTRRYSLPVSLDGGVYHVGDSGPVTESGSVTEQVTVPASYGPLREIGAPLALAAPLALLGALGVARVRGALTVPERARAATAFERTRAEFDDWISTGSVPETARQRPRVEIDSLEGLVDVAIDTDRRVVEDRGRDDFVVLGDAVTYVYRPSFRSDGTDAGVERPDPLVAESDVAANGDHLSLLSDSEGQPSNGDGGELTE